MSEKKTAGPADGEELERHLDRAELLYDELEDWLDCVTEETLDEAKLDRILSELNEIDPDPAIEAVAHIDVAASLAKFKRQHAEYFPDEVASTSADSSASPPAAKKPRSMKRIMQVVVPVAAATGVLFVGLFGAKAGGSGVFRIFAQGSEEVFQFRSEDQEQGVGAVVLSEGEEIHFEQLQEALDRLAIIDKLAPTKLYGYVVQDVLALKEADEIRIRATYEKDGDFLTIKIRQVKNLAYSATEKNRGDVPVYTSGDIDHYVMSNYDRLKATWLNGVWECTITASITVEEMEGVIDSIYS